MLNVTDNLVKTYEKKNSKENEEYPQNSSSDTTSK